MEDQVDLELRQDAVEQLAVEDGADVLVVHQRGQLLAQRIEVERDDRVGVGLGQARDEAVADLARGPGDQDDGLTQHGWSQRRG